MGEKPRALLPQTTPDPSTVPVPHCWEDSGVGTGLTGACGALLSGQILLAST